MGRVLRTHLLLYSLFCSWLGLLSFRVFGEIVLDDLEVRAGKDSSGFLRDLDSDEGPQSLVLVDENLFVSLTGVAVDDNLTSFPIGTVITWTLLVGDEAFPQPDTSVGADGSIFLATDFGFESDVLWVKVPNRGDTDIGIVGEIAGQPFEASVTVYAISSFESLLPLIVLVLLAILSRNVYIALFFGIWVGALVIEGGEIVASFRQLFDVHLVPTLIDEYNFRTNLFTLFLGGLIALMKHSGGQEGFSNFIATFATTPRTTQVAAVLAGVGLFFDDYSSALILGSSFKKLTDKFYISREKLAFVVDSTAAPISSTAPISSWIAFELNQIRPELVNIKGNSQFVAEAAKLPGEYGLFINTIPSRYYPFFMLVIQLTLIIAGVEFGPMLFTERKTRMQKRTDGGDGATDVSIGPNLTNPEPDTPRMAYNFFIPLLFFIATLLASMVQIGKVNIDANNEGKAEDQQVLYTVRDIFGFSDSFFALVYATMGASLFAAVFYLIQVKKDGKIVIPTPESILMMVDCRLKSSEDVAAGEILQVKEEQDIKDEATMPSQAKPLVQFTTSVNVWVEGLKDLVPAILVLSMAFTVKSIVKGCATDRFFTDIILNGDIAAEYFPTIIFLVSALLSFCTGTSFGTMSIMFPITSFAVWELSKGNEELFTVAMSSIMAGAIFGDHSSLISDTTILSSIGAGCSIGSHVYTQLPYAVVGAIWAVLLGTLPAGSGANPVAMLFVGGFFLMCFLILVGAPIVAANGRIDVFTNIYAYLTKSEYYEVLKEDTKKFAIENPELVDSDPYDMITKLFTIVKAKFSRPLTTEGAAEEEVKEDKATQSL